MTPRPKRPLTEKPQTYRLYVALRPSVYQSVRVASASDSRPIADILGQVISEAVENGRIGGSNGS